MALNSWISECLEMFDIASNAQEFIESLVFMDDLKQFIKSKNQIANIQGRHWYVIWKKKCGVFVMEKRSMIRTAGITRHERHRWGWL